MKYGSHSKMPNEGKAKSGGGMKGTNTGATGGLKKSSETRSDVRTSFRRVFPERTNVAVPQTATRRPGLLLPTREGPFY